jgi:DNA-binding NarL/FixJ family response regulator
LIEKNLQRAHITNAIVVLCDGQEAVAYFFPEGEDPTAARAMPLLVLLDLTTTDDPRDIERCYDLGCNVYITKSVEYERFTEAIRQLGLFLSVVKIPEGV